VVFCAAASLPASGSESAKQPMISPLASRGSHFFFCASVPNLRMGSSVSEFCTLMMTAVEAQARAISSSTSTYDTQSMPAPPYCSGTAMPRKPSSPILATSSFG